MSPTERLAREASLEIGVRELDDVEDSREYLAAGTRVYVNHLPGQAWAESVHACAVLRGAGLEPVPHVPVRAIGDERALGQLLAGLVVKARVADILLIAGDYDRAMGPYGQVADVLASSAWREAGLRRVTFAGHPEGHPGVPRAEIRRAEIAKAQAAAGLGLDATFVTQFVFEAAPAIEWAKQMRAAGVRARLVAGLAGPATLPTLFKFALRCGVGPSIRALGARPTSIARLTREHGPERLMREIAEASFPRSLTRQSISRGREPNLMNPEGIDGLHFFCFGGYRRTAEWLRAAATAEAA